MGSVKRRRCDAILAVLCVGCSCRGGWQWSPVEEACSDILSQRLAMTSCRGGLHSPLVEEVCSGLVEMGSQ